MNYTIPWLIIIIAVILGIISADWASPSKGAMTKYCWFKFIEKLKNFEYIALISTIAVIYGFYFLTTLIKIDNLLSVYSAFLLGGVLFGYLAKKTKGFFWEILIIIMMNSSIKSLIGIWHGGYIILGLFIVGIVLLNLGIFIGKKLKSYKHNKHNKQRRTK